MRFAAASTSVMVGVNGIGFLRQSSLSPSPAGCKVVAMKIHAASAPPFGKNGFVVSCEETREGVLIVPVTKSDLLDIIQRDRLTMNAILLTHTWILSRSLPGESRSACPGLAASRRPRLYQGVVRQGLMFGLSVDPQRRRPVLHDAASGSADMSGSAALRFARRRLSGHQS
jgi:hypothetical protein